MNNDRLIPLSEAAHMLSVCQRTIRRLCERGELPRPTKVGRCARLPLSVLVGYIKQSTEGTR